MAILKSSDGNFYEVPDDQLDSLAIPKDQLKEKLEECCGSMSNCSKGGPRGGGGAKSGGLINVHVYSGGGRGAPQGAEVEAYGSSYCGGGGYGGGGGYCGGWRNCWRNCC